MGLSIGGALQLGTTMINVGPKYLDFIASWTCSLCTIRAVGEIGTVTKSTETRVNISKQQTGVVWDVCHLADEFVAIWVGRR